MTSTTQDGGFVRSTPEDAVIGDDGRLLAAEDEPEEQRRGSRRLRLIGMAFGLIGVVAIGWYASQLVVERAGPPASQLPVLSADSAPVKVRPDDPGGAEIPNRDKYVYKSLESGAADPAPVEQLLPAPEEPMAKPDDPGPVIKPLASVSLGEAWVPAEPAVDAAADPAPAPSDEATAAEPPPSVAPLAEVAPSAGGVWLQLGSVRDEKGATGEWNRLMRRHAAALKGMTPRIDKADLGEKGVWYRLRAGPYADRDAAKAACLAIFGAGRPCKLSTP
jgi:hypothetical protein